MNVVWLVYEAKICIDIEIVIQHIIKDCSAAGDRGSDRLPATRAISVNDGSTIITDHWNYLRYDGCMGIAFKNNHLTPVQCMYLIEIPARWIVFNYSDSIETTLIVKITAGHSDENNALLIIEFIYIRFYCYHHIEK